MGQRPEFLTFDVDGASLGALRWDGRPGAPTVVCIHGITANAWSWDPVAHRLDDDATVVAVDLRGRGRSHEQPGPFGMRQHADDIAAIVEQLGGDPHLVAGHSMGAFVAMMTAERHPDAVRALVLVDGGTPIAVPHGEDLDDVLDEALGPAIQRLRQIWPDRVSYYTMWAQHPAFAEGISTDLERNLLADLIEVDGGFRTAVDEGAVRIDGRELLDDDEVRSLLERMMVPTTVVRASNGLMGVPPPLISEELSREYTRPRWIHADGTNHYSVLLGVTGATLVADIIRDALA